MEKKELTPKSIIHFGKYKGSALGDIPNSWFIWMYDRKLLSKDLMKYAEQNIRILEIQAKQLKFK